MVFRLENMFLNTASNRIIFSSRMNKKNIENNISSRKKFLDTIFHSKFVYEKDQYSARESLIKNFSTRNLYEK